MNLDAGNSIDTSGLLRILDQMPAARTEARLPMETTHAEIPDMQPPARPPLTLDDHPIKSALGQHINVWA